MNVILKIVSQSQNNEIVYCNDNYVKYQKLPSSTLILVVIQQLFKLKPICMEMKVKKHCITNYSTSNLLRRSTAIP